MSDDAYRVAIKPSAWRASAAAGQWVNRNGPTRTFESKALAREWARDCSGADVRVWVQDAVPWDAGDVDGYLVGHTPPPEEDRRSRDDERSDADERSTEDGQRTLAGAAEGVGKE